MARQASTFAIGLFVTIGIVIGVSAIVWIGATQYFEKGEIYVTYFDESVQGLQRDSSVKYRGVDVGRIVKIGVAPDNKLIEVVMKIRLKDNLEKTTTTQLKAVGITGIVFVELDHQLPGALTVAPKIDFVPAYPVIPSKPSETKQILAGIYEVIDKINAVDFEGISESIKSTAKAADDLIGSDRTKKIMANMESSTTALDKSMKKLDNILSERNLGGAIADARKAVTDACSLISEVRNELKDMKLKETAAKANQIVDGVGRSALSSAVDIQAAAENLEQASESLDRLLERIEANPSDLFFSKPAGRR